MKSSQRFDYRRFADSLIERGLADFETVEHIVGQCEATGGLMAEILVVDGLISDWEIARVACELYHLPFLTVDNYPPSTDALEGLDPDYLRQYGLVPLDRFGKLLTVVMPGIVPSAVLDALSFEGTQVLPLVGSISSNRRWLAEHLPAPEGQAMLEGVGAALPAGDWASIFDAGDEAVQLELGEGVDPAEFEAGLDAVLDAALDPGDLGGLGDGGSLDLGALDVGDLDLGGTPEIPETPQAPSEPSVADSIGGIELRLTDEDEG